MQEKHLKRVHLPQLSPVMWSWQQGYPRKELGVPIKPAYGMGAYEELPVPAQAPYTQVTGVNPAGTKLWNDLYRIGVVGKQSRVRPFGPSAFSGCGCGTDEASGFASSLGGALPFIAGAAGMLAVMILLERRTSPWEPPERR